MTSTSSSAKKHKAKVWRRRQIPLGEAFEDWKSLKESGGWTHNQLARHLLDVHERHCREDQECSASPKIHPNSSKKLLKSQEKLRVGQQPQKLTFSTPADDQEHYFPSEVSSLNDGEDDSEDSLAAAFQPLPGDASYFPSEVRSLNDSEDDSEDSLAAAFQPLPVASCSDLERSFVDEEVFNFTDVDEDGPAVEEGISGRLTGDCSPEEAVTEPKCVAFVSVLEELLKRVVSTLCPTEGCRGERVFTWTKRGSCAVVTWQCPVCNKKSVTGSWASQPRVGNMYAGNLILPATILLSGNSGRKVALMCHFAKLWFPHPTQFDRLQRLYFHPVIEEYWEETRRDLLTGIAHGSILAGDGRMDSPGHSAQYCTYSLMDHDRKCVISMACIDVRQAKHSHDMERVGFMKTMEDVIGLGIKVNELVTDAHSQIKSIMKTNEMFKNILHQTDIWHANKGLMKKLSAAGKKKECDILLSWMAAIRNHFWYACRTCEGDETKLKVTWSKVAQHIVNKHSWLDLEGFTDGGCDHEELPEERSKPWIVPNSPAHYELLGIVFDKNFMKSMPYLKNFRHTSYLESFHNHILMYASKRFSFSYIGYMTRNRLAAIDFNYHRNLPNMLDADGNVKVKAKFSKATKEWHPVPMKQPKDYGYIPGLLQRIVEARVHSPLLLQQIVDAGPDDPKTIRPRMTTVPKPPMQEMRQKFQSRIHGDDSQDQ